MLSSSCRKIALVLLMACLAQAIQGCTRMTLNKKRGTSSAITGGGLGGGGGPIVLAFSPSAPSVPLVYVNESDKSAVDFSVSCTAGNTIDLQITDSGAGSVTPLQQTCGAGGTYDFTSLDLSALADGALSILVTEITAAGGAPVTGTLSLTKDTVAPVLAGLGNSTTPAKIKTWSWSCTDAGSSNTCTYRFVAPGTSATGSPTGAYASTATASQSTGDGTYYVHVEGRDAAGNSSSVVTSSAVIDNTPPVVILSAKADRWDGLGTLSFAMISDEILSGVETTDIQDLQSGLGFSVALTLGTSGLSSYYEADYTVMGPEMISFLYLPVGVVSDIAGNATTAASLYSIPLAAGGSRETIQFEYSSYGFAETEATPVVKLKASGSVPYDVEVGIRTLDNGRSDALWGTEYTGLAGSPSARVGTVTLPAGQTEATLNLQLSNTLVFGQNRRIHLALISTDSPALVIGERDEASILIRGTSPDTTAGAGADWIQVARGLDHACQLNSRGQIKCWGLNATGQLGTGGGDSTDPVEISGGRRYVAVDAGSGFSCALDEDGQVWCWGANGSGQLGDGSDVSRSTPTAIAPPTAARFIQISIGKLAVCALSDDHQVYCWGDAPFTPTPALVTSVAPLGVRSVDMGAGHLCVVAHDFKAYCLGGIGSDGFGALGDGAPDSSGAGFTGPLVQVSGGLQVSSVAAGTDFSCAIAISGETYCWGLNDVGQLGDGTFTDSDAPVLITPSLQLREIWARNNIACGISVAGKLMCWGDGQNTPHELVLGSSSAAARTVSPGQESGCAIDPLGEVYCWDNLLPGFPTSATRVSDPSPDAAVEGVLGAAMGLYHSCLTTTSGKTQCWGTINSNKLVGSPMQDMTVPNSLWVVGGEDYALIQTTAGNIFSFGGNADRQLGRAITAPEPQETPFPIPTGTPGAPMEVLSATAGTTHGCALPASHQPKCWGSNAAGQIGIAAFGGNYPQPTTVPGVMMQIAAGFAHSCGIFTNGQLACWGSNSSGQLGDTTTTDRNSPTPVSLALMPVNPPDRAFIKISAGYDHTCAITTVGNAFCWGANQSGQLGDGDTADRSAPDFSKPVGSISDRFIDIVASQGAKFSCGITSAYKLVCWGNALGGVLGQGNPDQTTGLVLSPTEVSPGRRYRAVFANHDTCAIRTDGVFECFGSSPLHGSHPSLGSFAPAAIADPLALDKRFAVEVTPESTRQWQQISTARAFAAGQYGTNTCAIDLLGELHCWGIGFGSQGGELGDWGSELRSHPVVVDAGIPYQSVSVSETFACGVTTGGQLKCWGGPVGGVGSAVNYASLVDGAIRYTRVSAGNDFACAITVAGGVRCWGAGSSGQLGNGGTLSSTLPVSVAFPVGVGTIQKLAVGFAHACAVDHLQKLWCWGSDSHGQVGDGTVGTPVEQSTPVQIGSADHVDVVAGYRHTCSIQSDATVRCWGDNQSNQLGQGPSGLSGSATPTAVSGVTAVSQLVVSREPAATDTCAVDASKELYCWGLGSGGVPSGGASSAPVKASAGQYSRVAMSSYGGCGIEVSQTLSCWSTITGPYKSNSLGNGYFYGLPFPIK